MRPDSNIPSYALVHLQVGLPPPPPSQIFKIRVPRSQSKYEKYGEHILRYLIQSLTRVDDRRIPPFHRDAVLKTWRRLEEDKSRRLLALPQGIPTPDHTVLTPILIVAPAGTGKSGMIAMLPYALKSQKVLVLTPSKAGCALLGKLFGVKKGEPSFYEHVGITDILDCESSKKDFLEMPRIISSHSDDPSQDRDIVNNVVIVNVAKLGLGGQGGTSLLHEDEVIVEDAQWLFDQFDTLIIDEAHFYYPSGSWTSIAKCFSRPAKGMDKKIVFLTGSCTPAMKLQTFTLGRDDVASQPTRLIVISPDVEREETRPAHFIEKEDKATLAQDIFRLLEEQKRLEPRFPHQALVVVRSDEEAESVAQSLNKSLRDDHFAVPIVEEGPGQPLEQAAAFTCGEYRVAVAHNMLKEDYNNARISVCVIHRKISSRNMFSDFVGKCVRLNRCLSANGGAKDASKGMVLSYMEFNQKELWQEREMLLKNGESSGSN